jgi:LruC domain-containing protein
MPKRYRVLWAFLFLLILPTCKKHEQAPGTSMAEMKNLHVSPAFNWETSHDVTFKIYSDHSTLITITSEAGDIQYYRGFFNRIDSNFTVNLNIPTYVQQVHVNGIPVTISGNIIPVYLTNAPKSGTWCPGDIPAAGLIAAWHFDENAGNTVNDAAGGHNGVISGATWVSGIRGSALQFNGIDNLVQIPKAGFNPVGGSISFSFWFRLNAVGDNGSFIYQNVKYNISMDAQGRPGFALYTPVWKSVNSGYSNRVLDTDWHHVAMTYNGSEMKIYLDGLFRTSTTNTGNLQSSASDVYIGKQGTITPFKGTIDEMLMYDRALTEPEVLQIFGSTPDPGTGSDNLVSYYKLDENTGTTANDSKGANTGTITGATWGQGISGSCLVFDGTSGAVKVPSKLNLNPVYGITMMAWAKTASYATTKIFQKGDYDGHGLGLGNWDGWGAQIRLTGNITQGLSWGSGLPILNQWYHLAMTYDGQQLKFYVNGQLSNSKAVTGLLYVNSRDLAIGSDDGTQKFFKGSIDECKFFNRALDQTEIQANFSQTGNLPDHDGDGIPDADDSYPNDPARAFDNYSPVAGYGTLAFEDLWPGTGDYDFNDLVLDYRFRTITNANNKVTEVTATFVIRAIGAGLQNGFGFQLAGGSISDADVEAAGSRLTESFIHLNPNGTETGQGKVTVIVFDNVSKIMPSQGGFTVNTQPGMPYIKPDTTLVSLIFKPNTYSIRDIDIDHFNPFLIINLDRGKEIHLPDNLPTSLVNQAYFKTGDDDSDPASGRYYKTQTNLPWAIRISSGLDYTNETAQITSAYLKFALWAESDGIQYPDWFLKNSGYRDESNIYQVSK